MTITSLSIQPTLVDGKVVVNLTHDGQGCPNAKPARLHLHQNLLVEPKAGSDPVNQWNLNYQVGPDFPNSVTFDLMSAVAGKCFVQVDASAGTFRRGRFFPAAECPAPSSEPPSSQPPSSEPPSSEPPSSEPPSSQPPSSQPPSSQPPSQGVSGSSVTRAPRAVSPTPVNRETQPLASTGASVSESLGLAALLLAAGLWIAFAARLRRPERRH